MSDMSNWLRLAAFKLNDERKTPRMLVDLILPYVPKGKIIWCPFDTTESNFVKALIEAGHAVTYSHIKDGRNFFSYAPEYFDMIISNPPYSLKRAVLERVYSFNKPFALVLGLPILNYQEIGEFFVDKRLQLLIADKKVSFDGNTASFNNSYFCRDMLPRDLMFAHLPHNNSGKFYNKCN